MNGEVSRNLSRILDERDRERKREREKERERGYLKQETKETNEGR